MSQKRGVINGKLPLIEEENSAMCLLSPFSGEVFVVALDVLS